MQASSKQICLFTAMVANVAATEVLDFNHSDFAGMIVNGSPTSILNVSSTSGYKRFSWTMSTSVTIESIYLGIQNTPTVVGEGKTLFGTTNGRLIQNRDIGIPLQLNVSRWPSGEGGFVAFTADEMENLSAIHPGEPFFFQVRWVGVQDPTNTQYSYSQTWGLAHNRSGAEHMRESDPRFSYVASPIARDTLALLSVPTRTTELGRLTATTISPSGSSDGSPSKHGILSKGALIGIIVGGVAFLVLILIIAILCVRCRRRRRRRRNPQNKGDIDQDAQASMAEKEIRAAATALDTPDSVKSRQPLNLGRDLSRLDEYNMNMPRNLGDEGSQRSSVVAYSSLRHATSVGTGLAGYCGEDGDSPTVTHPSSSSSISLHEPRADPIQGQLARSTSRITADPINPNKGAESEQTQMPPSPDSLRDDFCPRANSSRLRTPQRGGSTSLVGSHKPGASSISAYLQEDGMTEDEIKRLEEEERVLDEAIEQARADSRAASGRGGIDAERRQI